ncbi:MAG: 4-hydroxy-3-methylbut-2-enyl diphosphate reductase [Bacteroidota bacterium]
MKFNIDDSAGFCWGVVRTIEIVEETLQKYPNRPVYVLGQIIHNPRESERLEKMGLCTIGHDDFPGIAAERPVVLIRAHGEPPSTYIAAEKHGIELIDATCPLVKNLQKRVAGFYKDGWQIVILGKHDHAEVVGLRGVCGDECIVVRTPAEALEKVDFSRKTVLVSQTTMDKFLFAEIRKALEKKAAKLHTIENCEFRARDTICKYVSGREEKLRDFAKANDAVLFVAGRNSSNGKMLYGICENANTRTYFMENYSEFRQEWLINAKNIGITGATSTPQWYLKYVKSQLEDKFSN